MPGGNRTGPMGMGPRTGRAAGFCAGLGAPGYANVAPGRGFGMGYGRGRGFGGGGWGRRHWFYATGTPGWMRYGSDPGYPVNDSAPNPEMEKQTLRNQADALKAEMDFIKSRLQELETRSASE